MQDVLKERVTAFKTTLNEKEVYILDHRLMSEEPRTLEDIGTTVSFIPGACKANRA